MPTYRDPETGRVLGAPDGSELDRRLREDHWDEVPDDTIEDGDEPAEKPAPRDSRLAQSRDELNALAVEAGVAEPEKLPSKPAVLAAIDAAGGGTNG